VPGVADKEKETLALQRWKNTAQHQLHIQQV
jgi:hypothetical protein